MVYEQVDPSDAYSIALVQLEALRDVAVKIEAVCHQQNTLLLWTSLGSFILNYLIVSFITFCFTQTFRILDYKMIQKLSGLCAYIIPPLT